jgi:hypothetical protein
MTMHAPAPSVPPPVEEDLSRTYTLVLVIEAVVILALYGLGRYFS